jgi:hypothetical protein
MNANVKTNATPRRPKLEIRRNPRPTHPPFSLLAFIVNQPQ